MFRQDFFYGPRNATEEMRSIFEVLIRALLPRFLPGRYFFLKVIVTAPNYLPTLHYEYMIFLHILQRG